MECAACGRELDPRQPVCPCWEDGNSTDPGGEDAVLEVERLLKRSRGWILVGFTDRREFHVGSPGDTAIADSILIL